MRKLFGDRAFLMRVLAIGLPIAMQNLLVNASTMIDTMMIGTQGQLAVAAVGLSSQFASLFFSAFFGFTSGGIVFFAQYWGARNLHGIRRAYGLAMSCMMVVSLLFCGASFFLPRWVLGIYTDKETIIDAGISYLRIMGFSFPLQALGMAMASLLRSTERVRIPLFAAIGAQVTNVPLNWLLIYGKFGLPQMGAAGAAVGTVAGGAVNIIVLYIYCIRGKDTILLRVSEHFRWSLDFIRLYFRKCAPIIANEVFYGVGQLLLNIIMGRQVEEAIAAMAVFRVVERIIFAFFSGFTNASAVIVGNHVGAGEPMAGYHAAKRFAFLCPFVTCIICLLILPARSFLLTLFGLSGEAHAFGMSMLLIYVVAGTLRTCNYIINDTFRAAGETLYGTVVELACLFLITVPAVWLSGIVFQLPFLVVFCLMFLDDPVRLPLMLRRLNSGKWIKPVTEEGKRAIPAFHLAMEKREG